MENATQFQKSEYTLVAIAILVAGSMIARLTLVLLAMVIAPGSRIDRKQNIGLAASRMRMMQTATTHHVYGHSKHNAGVESAVHDRSLSK